MKVVLAGAYGNLGADIFRSLIEAGHEVTALDMMGDTIAGVMSFAEYIKKSFSK